MARDKRRPSTGFVVYFETKKHGHRILGQIEAETPIEAHRRVTALLIENNVKEADIILPTQHYGEIRLVSGMIITIDPLVWFEDYASCVPHYMETGTFIDLASDEYSRISGALAES